MATAARPPGSTEARVPCPLCGGLIHPIAGKCKHCKADLSSYRAERPQAAAQLPSLQNALAAAPPPPPAAPAAPAHTNGHAPVAAPVVVATPTPAGPPAPSPWAPPAAHQAYQQSFPAPSTQSAPVQVAALHEASQQQVLPQRPSGMSWTHMQRQAPPRSAWRSWPMLVIIVAMIAIVTAVVIMVWPTSASRAAPSEDRHSLDVPKKPVRDDPWGPGGAIVAANPSDGNDAVIGQLTKHLCDRVTQCGNLGSVNSLCSFIDHASDPLPANCAAARRCLEHVDNLSCTDGIDDRAALQALLMKVPDCIDAIHC
jgi:hypothetical protein